MSPPPVRVETNAIRRPSGEYIGRDSVAGCDTSSRASPPLAGTVHTSPPETKAISPASGESEGSAKEAAGAGAAWAWGRRAATGRPPAGGRVRRCMSAGAGEGSPRPTTLGPPPHLHQRDVGIHERK